MFWASPTMSVGHLLFSSVATVYILLAVHFLEEPELIDSIGQDYKDYMKTTPSYCPFFETKSKKE